MTRRHGEATTLVLTKHGEADLTLDFGFVVEEVVDPTPTPTPGDPKDPVDPKELVDPKDPLPSTGSTALLASLAGLLLLAAGIVLVVNHRRKGNQEG